MTTKNILTIWNGRVYGQEPSEYALENGYLDYRTLAHIVDEMGGSVMNNSIMAATYECGYWDCENGTDYDEETDTYKDVYQHYIIGANAADWLQEHTDELLYYNDALDMWLWGITHFGTAWSHVLTDIKLVDYDDVHELY